MRILQMGLYIITPFVKALTYALRTFFHILCILLNVKCKKTIYLNGIYQLHRENYVNHINSSVINTNLNQNFL